MTTNKSTKVATEIRKKSPTKPVTKESISKPVVKASAKKAATSKFVGKSVAGLINSPMSGYTKRPNSDLLVPETTKEPKSTSATPKSKAVPASKIREGIASAQTEIKQSLHDIAKMMAMEFEVSEIEISLSFDAKGQFMGFGVAGAASIKVKIKPTSNAV